MTTFTTIWTWPLPPIRATSTAIAILLFWLIWTPFWVSRAHHKFKNTGNNSPFKKSKNITERAKMRGATAPVYEYARFRTRNGMGSIDGRRAHVLSVTHRVCKRIWYCLDFGMLPTVRTNSRFPRSVGPCTCTWSKLIYPHQQDTCSSCFS